jgi:hypothetical protein
VGDRVVGVGELHQLCWLWFGVEPFLGFDQELSQFRELFETQLNEFVWELGPSPRRRLRLLTRRLGEVDPFETGMHAAPSMC